MGLKKLALQPRMEPAVTRQNAIGASVLCLVWLAQSGLGRAQQSVAEPGLTPSWHLVPVAGSGNRHTIQPTQGSQVDSNGTGAFISAGDSPPSADGESLGENVSSSYRTPVESNIEQSRAVGSAVGYSSHLSDSERSPASDRQGPKPAENNPAESEFQSTSTDTLALQPLVPREQPASRHRDLVESELTATTAAATEGYLLQSIQPLRAVDARGPVIAEAQSSEGAINILPLSPATARDQQMGEGKYSIDRMTGPMASPPQLFSQLDIDEDFRQLGEHPLDEERLISGQQGFQAPWLETSFVWVTPTFAHQPLYFEQPNLERYGIGRPYVAPLASATHFYSSIGLLPVTMLANPPCEQVFTLGHRRPGNCVPRQASSLVSRFKRGATK